MYDETEYIEAIKEKYSQLELNYISPLDINLLEELKKLIEICLYQFAKHNSYNINIAFAVFKVQCHLKTPPNR